MRQMPANLEAEMSVLGIAFLNNYDVEKICEELYSDMFFDERNQVLFNIIEELHNSKTAIDATTVRDAIEKGKKTKIINLNYLTEVINSVVTTANLDYYINIVKENAIRRNLIKTANEIVTNSYDEENINELLDKSEQNILNVVRARSTGEFLQINEVLRRAQER